MPETFNCRGPRVGYRVLVTHVFRAYSAPPRASRVLLLLYRTATDECSTPRVRKRLVDVIG